MDDFKIRFNSHSIRRYQNDTDMKRKEPNLKVKNTAQKDTTPIVTHSHPNTPQPTTIEQSPFRGRQRRNRTDQV